VRAETKARSEPRRDEPARTYYGRPVVKQPVWKPEVPWYFFTGGLGGASTVLAFVAGLARNRPLARRSWLIAFAAFGLSPLLLIRDLGRPERFLNMLRVLKPTSPMSIGSWLLSITATSTGVATAGELFGWFPRIARYARPLAAACGPPLATYTSVLIANSAIPVWHEARRELPFVFAGSATASAGASAVIVTPSGCAGPARRLVVAGALIEIVAGDLMERRLGRLAATYRAGDAGRYRRSARLATVTGAAIVGLRGRRRSPAVLGAALVLAGSVLQRWAVFRAGFQSAADPQQTVEPQRSRAGVVGAIGE
jgi:polysulfide reductase-like protein